MMSGHYSFTSCFAPFIESMITEKRNAGFQYEHAEWILHKFDEFCNQEQVETPVITQELAGKWGTLCKTETKVTLAGRISVLRQLSLYMQAYGIKCYVPRNFTRKSSRIAYVLSIEEIQSLFLEIDSYQPEMPRSFIGWLWNTGSCFACFSAVGSGYQKPENYGWIWSTRKMVC